MAGGLPNYGRQKPPPTYMYSSDNRRLYPMVCFAVRGKGALEIEGVIVIVMSSLAIGAMNRGPSTVDVSLDFRESANEKPTKRGCDQKQNKCHTPLPQMKAT